jgi:hypothetical protein
LGKHVELRAQSELLGKRRGKQIPREIGRHVLTRLVLDDTSEPRSAQPNRRSIAALRPGASASAGSCPTPPSPCALGGSIHGGDHPYLPSTPQALTNDRPTAPPPAIPPRSLLPGRPASNLRHCRREHRHGDWRGSLDQQAALTVRVSDRTPTRIRRCHWSAVSVPFGLNEVIVRLKAEDSSLRTQRPGSRTEPPCRDARSRWIRRTWISTVCDERSLDVLHHEHRARAPAEMRNIRGRSASRRTRSSDRLPAWRDPRASTLGMVDHDEHQLSAPSSRDRIRESTWHWHLPSSAWKNPA